VPPSRDVAPAAAGRPSGEETTTDRFARYRRDGDRALRNELIVEHQWIAQYCARRYARRGEPLDDLFQVAQLGVLKAVERFDPARGVTFAAFAIPTALGELRRHFRDHTWPLRVSRRVKDLTIQIVGASPVLSQSAGHPPSTEEMATHLRVTPAEVEEANAALRSYRMMSLVPLLSDDEAAGDTLASDGGVVPDYVVLRAALGSLDERDRRIIVLRFFAGLTQAEIGARLGTNQVQVSRRLHLIFEALRKGIGDPAAV
jgi:RNA polymerase sigma-B factor